MNTTRILAAAMGVAVISFPTFTASLVASVLLFGSLTFAGAWLMDRYADLPGDDRRRA